MKNILKKTAALALVFSLSACTAIDYSDVSTAQTTTENHETQIITEPEQSESDADLNPIVEPLLTPQEFSETMQLEGNCDATTHTALEGYDGDGYIQLGVNGYVSVSVTVPTAQHYKLTLYICSAACKVEVITGGENEVDSPDGDYKTVDGNSAGAFYIEESVAFKPFALDGIYLGEGENIITLQALSGTAYVDKLVLENGNRVSDDYYLTPSSPLDKNADTQTVRIMNYLHDIYGKRTLTGQYVTVNTDAELYAIYNETGRFPAIRASDLAVYMERYPYVSGENNDIELAAAWAERGGLVSYSWTWYSPSEAQSHYLSASTDFDFKKAYTTAEFSDASLDTIKGLWGDGTISEETYLLVKDLDEMAVNLSELQELGVTVLFRPLMEAGGGWYWWGEDADAYKWLWQFMVKRYKSFHGLHNIIWVWNGESTEFYPGDDFVDIISEDVYGGLLDSASNRFANTFLYPSSGKAAALSECSSVPDPSSIYRDNSVWQWFCVWRGDYIIDENGKFADTYTSSARLDYAYNHQLFITLDELPDLKSYSSEIS